jgi:hypothetical protein
MARPTGRPTGRPSVITKALEAKIAQCFFDGFNDEETALFCDISKRTIVRARSSAEGFCLRIKKAELAKRAECLARVRAGTGSNWQGTAWFLERRWPTVYSKPEVQLQVTNQIGPQFNNVTILAPKIARELQAREVVLDAEVTELLGSEPSPNGKSA